MEEYNFSKLQELNVPHTFRNWREIMEFVGAPKDLAGNSKVSFQNMVKSFVDLHKGNGNQIIIERIKDGIDFEINTQGSRYQKLAIELISHILMTESEDYTINTLALKIGCINSDYVDANRHRLRTAKNMKINVDTVDWFFDSMHNRIKNIIVASLDKMVQSGLIEYKVALKGKYHENKVVNQELKYNETTDDYDVAFGVDKLEEYRFLTADEIEVYNQTMSDLYKKYNITGENQLYSKDRGVKNEFYKEKKRVIFDKLKYIHTFDGYIIEPIKKLKCMQKDEFASKKMQLNSLVSTGFREKIQNIIAEEKRNFNNICMLRELELIGADEEQREMIDNYIEQNRDKYSYNENEQNIDNREILTRQYIDISLDTLFPTQQKNKV